jgi:TolB-like protein/Flp pilus assembly protein TadD
MSLLFGNCVIDAGRRELWRAGKAVHVEPQVFDLLLYLIENRGRVATKDDLLSAVWQKRAVSDSTLNNRVNAARQVIGDSGEQQLFIRTIPRRGFRFVGEVRQSPGEDAQQQFVANAVGNVSGVVALAEVPSIAVLPFENMSGDSAQDYFVDGMVEDIITSLTRLRWLRVTSRTSSYQFKGEKLDVREIARRLGIRYVIEGSVRKSQDRVRVTGQLVDGASGAQLWAARYDREIDNIFDIQDELTAAVVGALYPELGKAEQERAKAKRVDSLDAWDAYQQGMWHTNRRTPSDLATGIQYFRKSIALESDFAPAYWGSAIAYYYILLFGWSESRDEMLVEALAVARRGVELDPEDSMSHIALGYILFLARDYSATIAALKTAMELAPHNYLAPRMLGITLTGAGRASEAIPYFHHALALSPNDAFVGGTYSWMAMAYFFSEGPDAATEWARKGVRHRQAPQTWTVTTLITILSHLGQQDEAERTCAELLRTQPNVSCTFVQTNIPLSDPHQLKQYTDGLRKAGLPE